MKKFLSLILVAVMLLTAVPVAVAEGNTYKVGDIVQFGSYPQSKVTDSATKTALNSLAPKWENWTSYGYYSGENAFGSMKQGDWMRYTDITYKDNKYRGVKFTKYRPSWTCGVSINEYDTEQDDNGYDISTVYWFKFEPIDWRVLDPVKGFLMCVTLIDAQPYNSTIYLDGSPDGAFNDPYFRNLANDYETSSIRKWLNNDFYNTAFTDKEKQEISTTVLNNDGYCTSMGITGAEIFDGNETNDKVFLLSVNEIKNSDYGFNSTYHDIDSIRSVKGSDYAKSQGLSVCRDFESDCYGKSRWILRSAGSIYEGSSYVNPDGYAGYYAGVSYTYNGIRPALCLKNIYEHQHNYDEVLTSPTCTDNGYITYTCECGDTYKVTLPEKGHSYKNGWQALMLPTCTNTGVSIRICNVCLTKETKEESAKGHNFSGSVCTECGYDKADTCPCRCHKSDLSALIWKILNFFYKLLGKNPICACGTAHY